MGRKSLSTVQLDEVREQIRSFKSSTGVDKVVILWTANTERYSSVVEGLNDTAENFLKAIENNEAEVAPSSIYAAAAIQEGDHFVLRLICGCYTFVWTAIL